MKQPIRERLPRKRRSNTFAFRVADCEGYVTVGEYEDGRPGEVFMKVSKQGSTLAGVMDAFSIAVSLGLQHGVPLATFVRKYTNMRFEPAGITDDAELRIAASLVDYIFRRLAVDYLAYEDRRDLGVLTTGERIQQTLPGMEDLAPPAGSELVQGFSAISGSGSGEGDAGFTGMSHGASGGSGAIAEAPGVPSRPLERMEARDAPYCYQCGNAMQRSGSCYVCASCGTTSGCS